MMLMLHASIPGLPIPSLIKGGSFAAILVVSFTLTIAGCAVKKPLLEQPKIKNKLDLRLQSALGGKGMGEEIGDYIRVIVRLKTDGTREDLTILNRYGVATPFLGAVTTMTLEPSKVVQVAALKQVVFIELDSINVPKPVPPPPPAGEMSR